MNLVPSDLNQRLANAVRYSVAADRFYITGKSGFWRLIGFGIILFGIGVATGLGFYGYSYILRNSDRSNTLASVFSEALAKARLRADAEGTVQLEHPEIKLAEVQTASLDSRSRLLLDPSASVRADGDITIQGPAISGPKATTTTASPLPSIANFTVFKSVPFNKGVVQTGWTFLTSAQRSPTRQYCYYAEDADTPGRNVMLDIGVDERLDAPKILPPGFELTAAFGRCVWFKKDNS